MRQSHARREGVLNLSRAVHGRDEHDGDAPAHREAELASLVRELVRVVGVAHVLHRVVEHEVDELVIALERATHLTPAAELDADLLVHVPVG